MWTENWFRFVEFLVVIAFLQALYQRSSNIYLLVFTLVSYVAICFYTTYKVLDALSDKFLSKTKEDNPLIASVVFTLVSAGTWIVINQILKVVINI